MAQIVASRPGIWLIEADVEDFQVRSALITGKHRAVVWDTLTRPEDMAGVAALAGNLPITVVYSHGDWDHVWGTSGLSGAGEEIIAHKACAPRFTGELPATLAEKRAECPTSYREVRLEPPTRTFEDRADIELGGATLQLHAFPGHTWDSVVGFIPEWGVFLAGDAVEAPLPFLNPDSPVREWAAGLELWADHLESAAPAVLVIPSHGDPGGTELLRGNANYLKDLMAGRGLLLPGELAGFYAETHRENRAILRRQGFGSGGRE